jgi:hypothetical protein
MAQANNPGWRSQKPLWYNPNGKGIAGQEETLLGE